MNKFFIAALVWVAAVIGVLIYAQNSAPYDSTDNPPHRSGMEVLTDGMTGCQYLTAPWPGGLAPRLDASGKPICDGRAK